VEDGELVWVSFRVRRLRLDPVVETRNVSRRGAIIALFRNI
jgi:hypothetical protein